MHLYHTVIKAYDFLIEAIKWQLLFIIIASFITVLGLCYHCSFNVIRNRSPWQIFLADFGLSLLIVISLFSPCFFGDRVHSEVRRLRELLASRLYENKLELKTFFKIRLSITRALLAFTETRDLSFSSCLSRKYLKGNY
ncbi:hypothetical protein K1T71_009747 [Dendrolimus kikuchii]|uniref:Uncharacterized protein n=1 Tax=Dendrolimus kikuchii TaxID=765133 RepID=A0ACC1CTB2_9NEOP|nr:hypothetical protein K1T71_009747 [Dendrolimus kikuchii]